MNVEMFEGDSSYIDESVIFDLIQPLNGVDARRRLENKLDDLHLLRELKDFDFDFDD